MQYPSLVRELGLWKGKPIVLARLSGGATNVKYLIKCAGQSYVARFLGEEQEKFLRLNRAHEVPNTKLAYRRGVGPRVIAHYPKRRLLIVSFIPGQVLRKQTIRKPANLRRVVRLLRTLHQGNGFRGLFDAQESIRYFEKTIKRDGKSIPIGARGKEKLAECFTIVRKNPRKPVPCHIDPMPQNFVRTSTGLKLIDWEYSATGDPMFDLAFVSAISRFGRRLNEEFLGMYFDRVTDDIRRQFYATRALVYYREAVWSLVQLGRSSLPFDYRRYFQKNMRWFLQASL